MALASAPASLPCCCGSFFLLAAGVAAAAYGAKEYLLVQKIENTPTSRVRSVAVGLAEIKGKARCREELSSPISGAKCAYWRVTAEYYYQTKNSSGWRMFYEDRSSKPFYVEDDTGRMLVDPAGGEVGIALDFESQGNLSGKALFGLLSVKQLAPPVLSFLDAHPDVKSRFQAHSRTTIRVREYYIGDGDGLYALGSAEPLEGAAPSAAHEENLVLRKGKFDQTMFVSDSPEEKITGNRKWVSLASLLLGLGMAAAGLLMSLLSISALAL